MQPTRRPMAPLVLSVAALVAAGGFVHLREWLDSYRFIPSAVPGSVVVRVGFPVNAAISFALAGLLVVLAVRARRSHRVTNIALGVTALFQVGSLATLILSRTGSVFGWSEAVWTRGAAQSRAVEIGALILLAGLGTLQLLAERRQPEPARITSR